MLDRFRLPRLPLSRRRMAEWARLLRRDPRQARWFLARALSRRPSRSALTDGVPWVPFDVCAWLQEHVSRDDRVFEWGSGGSTVFLGSRVESLVSIEHDLEWHRRVKAELGRLGLSRVDYRWIAPEPEPPAEQRYSSGHSTARGLGFRAYVETIRDFSDESFDLILIDGRARTSCLEAAWNKVSRGGHVLLDNSDYARYQPFLTTPEGFVRRDFVGASPYGVAVCTQSTLWRRS